MASPRISRELGPVSPHACTWSPPDNYIHRMQVSANYAAKQSARDPWLRKIRERAGVKVG